VNRQTRSAPDPDALALLSHELRTPLNALIGYAEAMSAQTFGPLPAPYVQPAEIIRRAALHLSALVDDFAEAAHAGAAPWSHRPERIDPRGLAEEAIGLLSRRAARQGVALRGDLAAAPEALVADRRALSQILINLLDNALKHTGAGGEVILTMARDGADLRIVVDDSGASRAETGEGDSDGQGLGFALSHALCALHGGALALAPNARGGMTATARLPVNAER
jgi:cell cycle sensor histidine kinase DivJ